MKKSHWLRWLAIGILLLMPAVLKWAVISSQKPWNGYWTWLAFIVVVSIVSAVMQKEVRESAPMLLVRIGGNILVSGAVYAVMSRLVIVSASPFPLYWSEGNRFYDYSTLFGGDRYQITGGGRAEAFITPGMALPWSLPFIFPGLSIWIFRLYYQLVWIVPPLLLGWIAARSEKLTKTKRIFPLVFGLWVFLFLEQGPVYIPLVLSAILVVLSVKAKVGFAIILTIAASYYAHYSRWTWSFAPGLWAVLLTLLEANKADFRGSGWKESLKRPIVLGLAGLVGGLILPFLSGSEMAASLINPVPFTARQPLLWSRLLPNNTFTPGILLAALWAMLPILLLICVISIKKIWQLHWIQMAALVLVLLGLLTVGLIASVKIGGGSNLHNLDMLLICLVLIASTLYSKLMCVEKIAKNKKILMALLVLMVITSPVAYTLQKQTQPLMPPDNTVQEALVVIQQWVPRAAQQGEVLFIDQRQMLTFGYLEDVPLINDYEKKLLMDMAMSGNKGYFEEFYTDLAAQRFSLIVNEPSVLISKGSRMAFAEENNAYVKWVTFPLLCNYYPVYTSHDTNLELLLPRTMLPTGDARCAEYLSVEAPPS